MSRIEPRTFRGTRDFLPAELIPRRKIVKVIEEAYRRYGFQPLETPAIEYLDILTGKSEENDKLIYEIRRARGDAEETAESAIALRYDLTVPLARVVAQYADLPRPFKRYQIQPVWRADRPQPRQGRYREFVQCDADIVGTDSLIADAELVVLVNEVLSQLGFVDYLIRISSRKFLYGLALAVTQERSKFFDFCRSLDKIEKIGWEGVAEEFKLADISSSNARNHLEIFNLHLRDKAKPDFEALAGSIHNLFKNRYDTEPTAREAAEGIIDGLSEIQSLYENSISLGVPEESIVCDPYLARGLDYYTGPIFEAHLQNLPHLGSLSGGGRYDGLIGTFSKYSVPATGVTIGLDRIQTALTQLGKFASEPSETQVLIARFDDAGVSQSLELASTLRRTGLRVEIWYDNDRMKKQFSYADQQKIPFVVVCGPDERARNEVSLKNLQTQQQQTIPVSELSATLAKELKSLESRAGSPDPAEM